MAAVDAEVSGPYFPLRRLETDVILLFQLNGRDWSPPAMLTANPIIEACKRHVLVDGSGPLNDGLNTLMDRVSANFGAGTK